VSERSAPIGGTATLHGLTSSEALQRLQQYGPNAVVEERSHPGLVLLRKFWAPVPWMLEAAIVLQIALGKIHEAAVIATLLVVNAALSFAQEHRANTALTLLKKRLAVQTRVLRDSRWQLLSAQELVPGDVVYLRQGDFVPADTRVQDGQVLLDQSALTGESLPVEGSVGAIAYAGTVIKRGEAAGEVIATGVRTYFGKTAELVRTAKTASHLETVILTIVKYLVTLDVVLVAALLAYAWATRMPFAEVIPFALILLVASVPVALPATFTLASSLGAVELAKRGVLVTRLSAIEEAAAMDVLASDKTGTITQNRLTMAAMRPYAPHADDELLRLAAMACDEATQDPIDLAILDAARSRQLLFNVPQRVRFIPFDPETKRSEAVFDQNGEPLRVLKGAPRVIAALVQGVPDVGADIERLAAHGYRVLGVASGTGDALRLAGLIAFEDPLREDSRALVQRLRDLGVRVLMVTGDGIAIARTVAVQVGIGGNACPAEALRAEIDKRVHDCDVFARVLPEDKFRLVEALQRAGHVVGMTGDGVNDAPALKQAEVGVAVANATDVAKAAASIVLTNPGLTDVQATVETSRRIYQRMLTYALNMSIKKFVVAFFLSLGVMITGTFVVTPVLIVLWVITNDFITMSITTDRVSPSRRPDRWRIRPLLLASSAMSACFLLFSFAVYFTGRDWLHLPLAQLQTLIFVMLVFTGQGTVYLVRERDHFWRSLPSRWLLLSSVLDIVVVSLLATHGILMAPINPTLVGTLLVLVLLFLAAVDFLKIRIFSYLGLH
jgi:H+-transporting ATPase